MDGRSRGGVDLDDDRDGYIVNLLTEVPAAQDDLTIKITNVKNVNRARPLEASFTMTLTDSSGGLIAFG